MKKQPINTIYASGTANVQVPTEEAYRQGIIFGSTVVSDIPNGIMQMFSEAIQFNQLAGNIYVDTQVYPVRAVVKVLYRNSANKLSTKWFMKVTETTANVPPITAPSTVINDVMIFTNADVIDTVNWEECASGGGGQAFINSTHVTDPLTNPDPLITSQREFNDNIKSSAFEVTSTQVTRPFSAYPIQALENQEKWNTRQLENSFTYSEWRPSPFKDSLGGSIVDQYRLIYHPILDVGSSSGSAIQLTSDDDFELIGTRAVTPFSGGVYIIWLPKAVVSLASCTVQAVSTGSPETNPQLTSTYELVDPWHVKIVIWTQMQPINLAISFSIVGRRTPTPMGGLPTAVNKQVWLSYVRGRGILRYSYDGVGAIQETAVRPSEAWMTMNRWFFYGSGIIFYCKLIDASGFDLYRSEDNGQTFTGVVLPNSYEIIAPLLQTSGATVFCVGANGRLFALVSTGGLINIHLIYSDDKGLTWTEATGLITRCTFLLYAGNGRVVIYGGGGVTSYSDDSGTTWTPVLANPTNFQCRDIFPLGNGNFVLYGDNGYQSWSSDFLGSVAASTGIPPSDTIRNATYIGNGQVFACGTQELYLSYDMGRTYVNTHRGNSQAIIDLGNGRLIDIGDNGVATSASLGASWWQLFAYRIWDIVQNLGNSVLVFLNLSGQGTAVGEEMYVMKEFGLPTKLPFDVKQGSSLSPVFFENQLRGQL